MNKYPLIKLVAAALFAVVAFAFGYSADQFVLRHTRFDNAALCARIVELRDQNAEMERWHTNVVAALLRAQDRRDKAESELDECRIENAKLRFGELKERYSIGLTNLASGGGFYFIITNTSPSTDFWQ